MLIMIKAISFDCYGTLVDWLYSFKKFFKYFYDDRYLEFMNRFMRCEFEKVSSGKYVPYIEILRYCLCECCSDICEEDYAHTLSLLFSRSIPFPDTVIGLKLLKKLGIIIIVFSNTDRILIENTLKGLEDYIDIIVTAEDLKCYKPNIECFKRFLNYVNLKPSELLHVSAYPQYDLEPAEKVGINTLLVNRYGYKWRESVDDIVGVFKYVRERFGL